MFPEEPTVLVLAPVGRDALVVASILAKSRVKTRICADLQEVLPLLDLAQCLVVAEEGLTSSDRGAFASPLDARR